MGLFRAGVVAATSVLSWSLLVLPAYGEPRVTLGIDLFDTFNAPLVPIAPNTYSIPVHENFRVGVHARLSSPNMTDGSHTDPEGNPLPPIELGMQSLVVSLLSIGAPNVISPISNPGTPSRPNLRWGLTSTSAAQAFVAGAPAWVNITDTDMDGDLDAAGAGFATVATIFAGYGGDSDEAYFQSLQIGLGTQTNILLGGYSANATGTAVLRFGTRTDTPPGARYNIDFAALTLFDPSVQDNSLRAEQITDIVVETPPTIIVHAPEPSGAISAAFGLVILMMLASAGRSRTARR